MFRLKPAQRRVLVDKVPDVANIGAGAFVFSQFVLIAGGERHD